MARILFCHLFTGNLLMTASECLMYDSADVESVLQLSGFTHQFQSPTRTRNEPQ